MQTVAYLQLFSTKVHNVTGNKYKFVQVVQEAAANDHILTVAIDKVL